MKHKLWYLYLMQKCCY